MGTATTKLTKSAPAFRCRPCVSPANRIYWLSPTGGFGEMDNNEFPDATSDNYEEVRERIAGELTATRDHDWWNYKGLKNDVHVYTASMPESTVPRPRLRSLFTAWTTGSF